LDSLFIKTSMPLFLATAMHEHWSPMSNPATDMLHDSSQGQDQLAVRWGDSEADGPDRF